MECPACNHSDTGEIHFEAVADGATFHYCRGCEHRWWVAQGENIDLDTVLSQTLDLPKAS